jgi:RHH-type transcriptional regulator, rel operon repressor / antitoxin RelB
MLIYGRIGTISREDGFAIQREFAVLSAHYRIVYIELDLPENSLAHNGGIVYNILQDKQGGVSLSTPISIRIPDGLASQLDGIARETDRPRSYIVQKALESYLEDYADLQIALDRLHDGSDEVITGKELRKKLGL